MRTRPAARRWSTTPGEAGVTARSSSRWWRRGGLLDSIAAPVLVITSAIPYFWVGMMFILIFGLKLQWLPWSGGFNISDTPAWTASYIGDVFEHAVNQPQEIPPNTEWRYRNSDPLTLGKIVRDIVEALYQKHVRTVEQVGGINADEFGVLNKALHRLERFWTDQILYRL